MLHGRLSAMLGARSILDSVTPSCEGRPPAGPRGPLPHLRARLARRHSLRPLFARAGIFTKLARMMRREGEGVSGLARHSGERIGASPESRVPHEFWQN